MRQSYIYHINIKYMYLSGDVLEWHILKMKLGQGNRLRVMVFHQLDARWRPGMSCLQLSDYMKPLVFMGILFHY